eukprot:23016-Pelagococcus_subviridis.AAC.1
MGTSVLRTHLVGGVGGQPGAHALRIHERPHAAVRDGVHARERADARVGALRARARALQATVQVALLRARRSRGALRGLRGHQTAMRKTMRMRAVLYERMSGWS